MYATYGLRNNWKALLILITSVAIQWQAKGQSFFQAITGHDRSSAYVSVCINGKPVETSKYKDFQYASFQQKGNVQIQVKCSEEIKSYTISPLSKSIKGKLLNTRLLQFNLAKPSYLVIKLNNKERLFLFAEETEKKPAGEVVNIRSYHVDTTGRTLNTSQIQQAINEAAERKKTLVFPAGIYKSGSLFIPSHSKIFLGSGALLKASDEISDFETNGQRSKGFINILDAQNISISGLGIIDGNGRSLRDKYADRARLRLLYLNGGQNVQIVGITQRDPGSWNTQIQYSEDVLFNHVKLLNDVALANTDGFDPDASSQITIQNCFAYCGDDNVAIKITQENGKKNFTSDITVQNCVFLTRKSSLKVGTESRGSTIKNILFENNDVIMSDRGMALYCSDGAVYENIRYINNRFEENYVDAKQMGIHFTINKRNETSREGVMKNVIIDNCSFYAPFPKGSEIKGLSEAHNIDLVIRNLNIAGKKATSINDAGINASFATIKIE